MNTQNLSPLGWTGWISLQSKGLSKVFSITTAQSIKVHSLKMKENISVGLEIQSSQIQNREIVCGGGRSLVGLNMHLKVLIRTFWVGHGADLAV